jgi:hypothetical protein
VFFEGRKKNLVFSIKQVGIVWLLLLSRGKRVVTWFPRRYEKLYARCLSWKRVGKKWKEKDLKAFNVKWFVSQAEMWAERREIFTWKFSEVFLMSYDFSMDWKMWSFRRNALTWFPIKRSTTSDTFRMIFHHVSQ